MRRLYLLRHAKAVQDASGGDHERPLNARGREDAPMAARAAAARGFVPALVLCSTAKRTSETLALALPFFTPPPEVRMTPALYHAAPETILAQLGSIPADIGSVMIVGHNPGLQDLAAELAGAGKMGRRIEEKFPTSAFVAFESASADWRAAIRGPWTALDFIRVSEL